MTYRFPAVLCSRFSFRLSVRQVVSRVILRGSPLRYTTQCPIWAHFLDLHSVEIGDLALHVANGCNLINGLNMDGHDEAGFHGEEIGQAAVIQIRRKDGEEADLTLPIAYPEGVLVTEVKAGWNDEVLGRKSGGREPFPVEEEGLGVHVEHIVHEL